MLLSIYQQLTNLYPYLFLTITGLVIFCTIRVVRRIGTGGCIAYGYIGLIVFCIFTFCITSWAFLAGTTVQTISGLTTGQRYEAIVKDYIKEERYDSDQQGHYTMYTPIVQFRTTSGEEVVKQLGFSTSEIRIGDPYTVMYSERTGQILTLGFPLVLTFVASLLFCIIFTTLTVGVTLFARGQPMERYWKLVRIIGFYGLIPFMMISFDALLIYAMFYGNEQPGWVYALLLFFILVLTLGIWGYLKMLLQQGMPQMKRVSATRWTGGWSNRK